MAVSAPPRLLAAQWRAAERQRQAVIARALNLWAQAGYAAEAIQPTVALVLDGQALVVAQTDAALSLAAGLATGTDTSPIGLDPAPFIGRAGRNGTALETAYGRTLRVAGEDGPARAASYLTQVVRTDLQIAQRGAALAHNLADRRVVGWRRQTSPGGKTCGLCVAASTRIYRRGDLLAIHRHCRCTVYELYSSDPIRGDLLDMERLQAVYADAGGLTDARTLGALQYADHELPPGIDTDAIRKLNVRVVNDPELGPLLDGDRHDTSFDIAA